MKIVRVFAVCAVVAAMSLQPVLAGPPAQSKSEVGSCVSTFVSSDAYGFSFGIGAFIQFFKAIGLWNPPIGQSAQDVINDCKGS